MDRRNRRYQLAKVPDGQPSADLFELVDMPVPEPGQSQALMRTLYVSLEPYIHQVMGDSEDYGVGTPTVGEPIRGRLIGEIVESTIPDLEPGTVVRGGHFPWSEHLPWAEYNVVTTDEVEPVDTGDAPLSTAVGVLGTGGRTAYFGMFEVGDPRPGETVVVSSAAGATGSVAGQLAKFAGCRVVGIAGADEKVDFITEECGMDAGINYKTTDDLAGAVAEACPEGVDLYFDNVGGELSDAVISQLATNATIVICGQIALYNEDDPTGPNHFLQFIYDRVRVQGFMQGDYAHRFEEAERYLARWVANGDLAYRETITEGFENVPEAYLGLFDGTNIGRQLVHVADPSR